MNLKYNKKLIQKVIRKSDILVVAISDSERFTKISASSNGRYNLNCIFHEDKHPSMMLNRNNNNFYCLSKKCKRYGDVIAFTMKLYNLDFISAVETLAYVFSVKLPPMDYIKIDYDVVNNIKKAKKSEVYKKLIEEEKLKTFVKK